MRRATRLCLLTALLVLLGLVVSRNVWPGAEVPRLVLQPIIAAVSNSAASSAPPLELWQTMSAAERLADVEKRRGAGIRAELAARRLALGRPVFIRVFKESAELELWMAETPDARSRYTLYKTWPIAALSGTLGPKLREGDRQAVEGCYAVDAKRMNPASNYHLSFNLGYPNAFDLAHGRTGNFLMVHGRNVSVGCYAMTDPVIEEIYLISAAALHGGQPAFAVHCFPFRMAATRMEQAKAEGSPWLEFWQQLQPIYDAFERSRLLPSVVVKEGRYELK